METFITSHLMGGLGNQMFQIAKAKTEGLIHNLPVFFRLTSFIPMDGKQPIIYKDNIFRNIDFKSNLQPVKRIDELTWDYKEQDYSIDSPTEFYGYYQSSKNFKKHKEKIRNLFLPTSEFIQKIKNTHPKILEKNSVSIHVRRGDYLNISNILPVIDKTYIDESLRVIGKYKHIFIFSNDKKWCEENLKYENSTIVYDLEDYEELWAISLCNHNIMSNSSFSWWGSYINKNKNKKVCVPSVWFGPNGEKKYTSIYEPDWEIIKTMYYNGKIIFK
jgi:hypothetical protein